MGIIKRPKIIWLHSHFLYWMGGTKFVYEVIKNLKKDFEIHIIVENATKTAIKKYRNIGVKITSLDKLTSTSPIYWATFPWQIFDDYLKLKNILAFKNCDLVVTSMFPMNLFPLIFKKKHVQYCFEPFAFFHDPEFIKNFPPFKRILIRSVSFLYKGLDIFSTGKAIKVVTLNNTTAKYIKNIYNVSPSLSFAGIDTKHFKPRVSKELKDKYSKKDIIVHSTDYTPVKRTETMLLIFAKTLKKWPKAYLLITSTINNDVEKNRLIGITNKLGIEKNVEFLGFVDYDVIPQIYSLAKILVQCSYSERSGTTSMALPVKEALACGTPCIRYPIKDEDVIDGQTGLLIDPRNEQKMVNGIIEILKWSDKKKVLSGIISRSFIIKRYTWKNTSNVVKRIINSIIQ